MLYKNYFFGGFAAFQFAGVVLGTVYNGIYICPGLC